MAVSSLKTWQTVLIFLYIGRLPTYMCLDANPVEFSLLKSESPLLPEFESPSDGQADYMDILTALDDLDLQHPVINHHKIAYLLNNENACSDVDVFVLALVRTSPDHFKERNKIRKTWASVKRQGNFHMVTMFVMGKGKVLTQKDQDIQDLLSKESNDNEDIVEGDFIDSYKNDTLSHLLGLIWAKQFCSQAKFLLVTDDSTMVDPYHLTRFLDQKSSQSGLEKFLYCSTLADIGPVRIPLSKRFVTMSDYPYDIYPPHCEEFAYILSNDLLDVLLEASRKVPSFWIGNVYLTGFLPAKLGLTHTEMEPDHAYNLMQDEHVSGDMTKNMFLTSGHSQLRKNWSNAWSSILKGNKNK